MEEWEIELRKKLIIELEDNIFYTISTGDNVVITGKHGYIEFQIALMKKCRNFSSTISSS